MCQTHNIQDSEMHVLEEVSYIDLSHCIKLVAFIYVCFMGVIVKLIHRATQKALLQV